MLQWGNRPHPTLLSEAGMKDAAKLFFRFLGALLVAGVIAGIQYLLWSLPNKGIIASAAGIGVQGFAYAPYQRDQDPLKKTYPTDAEISADLDIMAQSADRRSEEH